jgi:hypothetical protein
MEPLAASRGPGAPPCEQSPERVSNSTHRRCPNYGCADRPAPGSPTRMPSAGTGARVRRTGAPVSAYSSASGRDWRAGPAGWCVRAAHRNADGGHSRAGFAGLADGLRALAFPCGRWVRRCAALVRRCRALADGSPALAIPSTALADESPTWAIPSSALVDGSPAWVIPCAALVDGSPSLACGCGTSVHPRAAWAHACGPSVLPSPTWASACGHRSIPWCPLGIQLNLTRVSSGDLAVGFHALNPDAVSGPRSGAKGRGRQSEVPGELR